VKVLIVHNKYLYSGGEDVVVAAEKLMLENNDVEVELFQVSNERISDFFSKIRTAFSLSYSNSSRKIILKKLKDINPDIMHVHNFFPILSTSIYDASIEAGVPVVQTLHNYRTICPGALLVRDGNVCELCVKGNVYKSVLYRCYRNSFFSSWAVARMVAKHRKDGTWQKKVNRFIVLSECAKSKFISAGFPQNKLKLKPNFLLEGEYEDVCDKNGAIFVGRLSQEKGVATLMKAWEGLSVPLRVVGDGPFENKIFQSNNKFILPLGFLDAESTKQAVCKANFLVMPSECNETFGLVIIEAFSQGVAVIASRLGAMAEIVEDGITGLHFEAGNAKDLAEKVQWMSDHPEECKQMGKNARKVFEEKYTAEKNHEILMAIYHEAIEDSKRSVT